MKFSKLLQTILCALCLVADPSCAQLSASDSTCQSRLLLGSQLTSQPELTPESTPTAWPSANPGGLQQMNQARSIHKAPPLVWNATLSTLAQVSVDNCKTNQSVYPANYCMGQNTWSSCIGLWYAESLQYDYNALTISSDTSDFINMVWQTASQITGDGSIICMSSDQLLLTDELMFQSPSRSTDTAIQPKSKHMLDTGSNKERMWTQTCAYSLRGKQPRIKQQACTCAVPLYYIQPNHLNMRAMNSITNAQNIMGCCFM